mgnify:CR=1 FL=1
MKKKLILNIHLLLLCFWGAACEQKVKMDQSSKSISDYLKIESLTSCYQKSIHNDFDSFKSLWWVKDSHHNARGYHLMANCIYESIQPIVDSNYIKKFHK